MNINFGKYGVPPSLQKLLELHNVLDENEDIYDGLKFYPSLDLKNKYDITPYDVVVFGRLGSDGIHFGFLTDFGTVDSLEEALIVCMVPGNERPVRIVAKNLDDFLTINMTDQGLFYGEYESEKDYLTIKEEWESESYEPSEDEKAVEEKVKKFLKENFQLPIIENPYRYIRNIVRERESRLSIQTQDKLGVTVPLRNGEKHIPFPVSHDTEPDLQTLKEYLYSAPIASRLALIRDLQFNCILPDHKEINKIVIDALKNMGFTDEANRLAYDMEYNSSIGYHSNNTCFAYTNGPVENLDPFDINKLTEYFFSLSESDQFESAVKQGMPEDPFDIDPYFKDEELVFEVLVEIVPKLQQQGYKIYTYCTEYNDPDGKVIDISLDIEDTEYRTGEIEKAIHEGIKKLDIQREIAIKFNSINVKEKEMENLWLGEVLPQIWERMIGKKEFKTKSVAYSCKEGMMNIFIKTTIDKSHRKAAALANKIKTAVNEYLQSDHVKQIIGDDPYKIVVQDKNGEDIN